ncbi:uncharacterized protein LOC18022575 [Eutrema salsugineum]|nr:uncharacterized protein LOC18022575 [Eutrema salsugineum]
MVLCLNFLSLIPSLVSIPLTGNSATSLPDWICWNLWTARNHRNFLEYDLLSERSNHQRARRSKGIARSTMLTSQTSSTSSYEAESSSSTQEDERLLQLSASCHFVSSALAAEAWALRQALITAIDEGFEEIEVLSDSQILMNLINSQEMHTKIHVIVNDIRHLVLSFSLISFNYVPHTDNVEADTLAKNALGDLFVPH